MEYEPLLIDGTYAGLLTGRASEPPSVVAQRSAVEDAERAGRIEAGEAQERIERLLRARELIGGADRRDRNAD